MRWADLWLKYGKHRSQMSKITWEVMEIFIGKYRYALKMRGRFLRSRRKVRTRKFFIQRRFWIDVEGSSIAKRLKCVELVDIILIKKQCTLVVK